MNLPSAPSGRPGPHYLPAVAGNSWDLSNMWERSSGVPVQRAADTYLWGVLCPSGAGVESEWGGGVTSVGKNAWLAVNLYPGQPGHPVLWYSEIVSPVLNMTVCVHPQWIPEKYRIERGEMVTMEQSECDHSWKANLIGSITDKCTGAYRPHEYEEVTLPRSHQRICTGCIPAQTRGGRSSDTLSGGNHPAERILFGTPVFENCMSRAS